MTPHEHIVEEQDLLESYERGEWQSIPKLEEELQSYRAYATVTLAKNKLVGINLSPEDFQEIQNKARERGVPYQQLISDILHRFASGRLVEPS
jgi:predicted DNA binding CopG/RHH family protein